MSFIKGHVFHFSDNGNKYSLEEEKKLNCRLEISRSDSAWFVQQATMHAVIAVSCMQPKQAFLSCLILHRVLNVESIILI